MDRNPELETNINEWLKWDKNPETLAIVNDYIKKEKYDTLSEIMMKRLMFGTAGIRAKMGPGFARMNDVVVLQTAQGLYYYLKKHAPAHQLKKGIVVGFDGRYNSRRFAELTAKVFITHSVPVYLFSEVCPTPLVSFAILHYGCAGGVMVTASHNPREDNGYKVYWGNGSQIIEPHDIGIFNEILNNKTKTNDEYWNIENVTSDGLVTDCLEEMTKEYMAYIHSTLDKEILSTNKAVHLPIVYSAMHGVGWNFIKKAFETANLIEPYSVAEQEQPNPDFPTVKFPNPEEHECLERSKRLAEAKGCRLILANDPDADRLAVAEYNLESKSKFCKIFSGNEMGALLGWWMLEQYKKKPEVKPEDVYFIASVVSSKMLRTIAETEGYNFVETLTGFKWMGNTALLLAKENKLPLFAFEEAIGYMINARVPDKDGVSAAVHVASLASHLYQKGSSLQLQLQKLYRRYGYHITHNSYFHCDQPAIIEKIFRRIRNFHEPGSYPRVVGSNDIISMHDLVSRARFPEFEGIGQSPPMKGTGLDLPYTSGEMVMFRCENGLCVTVRTSGTEPKLKYYTEFVADAETQTEQGQVKIRLLEMVEEFIDDLIQPNTYGLRWKCSS